MAADTSPVPPPRADGAVLDADPALEGLDLTEPDAPLRSFAVLARLSGVDPADPVGDARSRLAQAGLHPQDIQPLTGAPGTSAAVRARFVEASLDGETAVRGLDETLRAAGLPVDEVWLDHQLD